MAASRSITQIRDADDFTGPATSNGLLFSVDSAHFGSSANAKLSGSGGFQFFTSGNSAYFNAGTEGFGTPIMAFYNSTSVLLWQISGAGHIDIQGATGLKIGLSTSQKIGFWNANPVVQPTVSGSRASGAALASLLTQLATLGLIVDGSSA